jgi:hypothetical protein
VLWSVSYVCHNFMGILVGQVVDESRVATAGMWTSVNAVMDRCTGMLLSYAPLRIPM